MPDVINGLVGFAHSAESAWPIQGLVKHFRPEMERRIVERNGGAIMEAAE
jgi:NADH:ubiquinone oxidoreductase subunit F (NADH-binding)